MNCSWCVPYKVLGRSLQTYFDYRLLSLSAYDKGLTAGVTILQKQQISPRWYIQGFVFAKV
jgi:hypothetical protein